VALFPTITLGNEMLVGEALNINVAGTVAVPDRPTGPILLDASLLMTRFPLKTPANMGAKLIAKVWDWPAATVKGGVGPLSAKEVPVTERFDTLSGEPPVLLTLTYCVALEAVVMLPNDTFAGEIVI